MFWFRPDCLYIARQECQGVEKWSWGFWRLVRVFGMAVGMQFLPSSGRSTANIPWKRTTFTEAIGLGMRERSLVTARQTASWLSSYALWNFRVRRRRILWCINTFKVSVSNAFLKDGSSRTLIKNLDVRKKGVCWRIWKIRESKYVSVSIYYIFSYFMF